MPNILQFILNNSTEIGLVFFFSFFTVTFFYTYRKGAKPIYDAHSKIPLQDEKI